jgi:pyruvate,orthophosphate dikinase
MNKIYRFGRGKADGGAELKNLLGGKGANLAEMAKIGIPVPPGFTLTTEMCNFYTENGEDKLRELIWEDVKTEVGIVEDTLGKKFGDSKDPLLFSVRSGARQSMPGMMDTVLNLGLNDIIVEGLSNITANPRFAWDSYRRFIQMYGDVVLGITPDTKEDVNPFEKIIDEYKEDLKIDSDLDFDVENLKVLVTRFKAIIKEKIGIDFPQDPYEQLWLAILAVFRSWMNDRAIAYRAIENIPSNWGTAVNVQSMVFGNTGPHSATGVAFTRNAATGENYFNGEFLINAQGEDVVAGVRTPQEITKKGSIEWAERNNINEEDRVKNHPSLEELMPEVYKDLFEVQEKLENHYKDMQDMEFTIENKKLWLLQTRTGKRTGMAMVKIAMDLYNEGKIEEAEVIRRIKISKIDELLHPIFDKSKIKVEALKRGLPAAPGAAVGQIVFFADEVDKYEKAILVRLETSPEDINGMNLAQGFLTVRGGMTSHAAVVARGMGKCCVAGAGEIVIDYKKRKFKVGNKVFREGDYISLDGSTGMVYEGKLVTQPPKLDENFHKILEISDKISKMEVRANADTPKDAKKAIEFGARGIGLCRTEHMFFEADKIRAVREMILAPDTAGREKALAKMLPLQKQDFIGIFEVMGDKPVTIRLLDPPLHEFLPHTKDKQEELAHEIHVPAGVIREAVEHLKESNPMLGHRGCRLGITYPEITAMQTRAIIEAAIEVQNSGIDVFPEIMVPLIGKVEEYKLQRDLILATITKVFKEKNSSVKYKIGTMIEVPRAALTADKIASEAEFFSFGTNDLTQMTFGYSRDDTGTFLPTYLEEGVLEVDPFKELDTEGVGQLIEIASTKGRNINSDLEIGICGEHGGEPNSIKFVNSLGFDYVSCSPYRIPIARLAAAKAEVEKE